MNLAESDAWIPDFTGIFQDGTNMTDVNLQKLNIAKHYMIIITNHIDLFSIFRLEKYLDEDENSKRSTKRQDIKQKP